MDTKQKEVRRPVAAPVAAAGARYSVRARAASSRRRAKYCATGTASGSAHED